MKRLIIVLVLVLLLPVIASIQLAQPAAGEVVVGERVVGEVDRLLRETGHATR